MKRLALVTLLVVAGLTGCSRHALLVHVDAIAGPDAQQKRRFVLVPADPEITKDDLQYNEYAQYAQRILVDSGFKQENSFDEADIAVLLSYKISDPDTKVWTEAVPIFGQTGVSSSTTYGTLSMYGNQARYSGTTVYRPTRGVVGHVPVTRSRTIYHRSMQLDAYDIAKFRESQSVVNVWRAAAISSGTTNDLRRVLPFLATAMKPHLGASTGYKVKMGVSPEDEYLNTLVGSPVRAFNDRK